MFERCTERAWRAIFFARYEASQFGSPYVEAEHLILGVFRADKALASRFLLSLASIESIRKRIAARTLSRERSVDLLLSDGCKRALDYGAEEAEQFNQRHIGTHHLLLGLLRDDGSFAAKLLRGQGLTLGWVREVVMQSEAPIPSRESALIDGLERWLAQCEASGEVWTVKHGRTKDGAMHLALYAGNSCEENDSSDDDGPAGKLAQMQRKIDAIVERMERAIVHHEFEKARSYSDEELKEREELRLLREQFHLEEPPPRVPSLCVETVNDDRFSGVQRRCDEHIGAGVPQVWILDPSSKRAYTATRSEGFREFKGEILQIADPPLQMDLNEIFG